MRTRVLGRRLPHGAIGAWRNRTKPYTPRVPDPLDDAPIVSSVILSAPLCLPCITAKTAISPARVRRALERAGKLVVITRTRDVCPECRRRTTVVRIGGGAVGGGSGGEK